MIRNKISLPNGNDATSLTSVYSHRTYMLIRKKTLIVAPKFANVMCCEARYTTQAQYFLLFLHHQSTS